jgi:hypothetical protein
MNCIRSFIWNDNLALRKERLLLCVGLFLACITWFILGALLAAPQINAGTLYLWGWFWIVGVIIALVFTRLLKTRQCQSA